MFDSEAMTRTSPFYSQSRCCMPLGVVHCTLCKCFSQLQANTVRTVVSSSCHYGDCIVEMVFLDVNHKGVEESLNIHSFSVELCGECLLCGLVDI